MLLYSSVPFSATFDANISGSPPSFISVPLPAIFVAIVTVLYLPACAIISASLSWCLAFNNSCGIFERFNKSDNSSECCIDAVPTSTGCPFSNNSCIFATIALYFARPVIYITSGKSFLITGIFVGTITTGNLYICLNSSSSVFAVPVIPDNFLYILK